MLLRLLAGNELDCPISNFDTVAPVVNDFNEVNDLCKLGSLLRLFYAFLFLKKMLFCEIYYVLNN